MSKRFKGRLCVYCCGEAGLTPDHIFARQFFLENARANLPQVPSCARCNSDKSKLEHYLTTVLPFGGRHADALGNLSSMVPKRLQKNQKLRRELAQHRSGPTIPLDSERLEDLFGLVARGLIWHHWNAYLDPARHSVRTAILTPAGMDLFDGLLFQRNGQDRVKENLGNGTFLYEGVQAVDDPATSIWRFLIYGGLAVSEEGDESGPVLCQIVAMTGPDTAMQMWDGIKQRSGERARQQSDQI